MSRRRTLNLPSVAIAIALLVSTWAPATLASPPLPAVASPVDLPITSFNDLVVDDGNDHLFLSQGFASTEIAVVDFTGTSVGTIPAAEAYGIALSADGSTLYAALRGNDQIGIYDAATLDPIGDPVDAGGPLNGELEIVGGSVWFGYEGGSCPETPGAYLGSMPLGGGTVTQHEGDDFPIGGPQLVASPSADVLVLSYPTCGGQTYSSWSASTDPPTLVAGPVVISAFAGALELSPNGATLFLSEFGVVYTYRTSDLTKRPAFYNPWPSGASSIAATAENGGWLAAADHPNPNPGPAVALFDIGGGNKPEEGYVGGDHRICRQGLAFTADATALFAIECADGGIRLHTIDRPTRFDPRVTISAAKLNVDAFEPVRITAHLPAFDNNGELRIERTPLDGNTTVLVQGTVNASGDLVATVRLTRQTRFVVRYTGDDGYLPGSDTITIRVRTVVTAEMLRPYGRSSGYALYHDDALYRATVKPPKAGKSVYVELHRLIDGRWREVATAHFKLNAKSLIRVTITDFPVGRYRVRTTRGSDTYNLQGVSDWDRFRITG